MARKAKGPGFTQKSGKSPAFKMMGSSPVRALDPYALRPGTNRADMSLPEYREYGQGILDRIGPQEIPTGNLYDPKEFDKLTKRAERQKDDLRKRWGWSSDDENSDNADSGDFWSQYSF